MSDFIYGIDLGTTNSIIGRNGVLISRLVPSKVDFKSRKCVNHYCIGDGIVGSYKVDMGLGDDGMLSVDASSIVLEELKGIVKKLTGDEVKRVVISVPAYFSSNQRSAVRLAAEKCGLELVTVINEPTAAAIQICSSDGSIMRRGVFAVYDLGGGTFDCTIIDSRSGKYQVVGTDGCILGGDNLDYNIAFEVMSRAKVPIYKRKDLAVSELVYNCSKWKLEMQRKYNEMCSDNAVGYIDIPKDMISGDISSIKMSLGDYKKLVRDTFGKTVSILSNLIDSRVPKGVDVTVVFVGGSTHCSYLCSYVLKSANIPYDHAEFDKNPDYTVAVGVSKYAKYLQDGLEDVEFKDVTKQLSIEDKDGKALVIIPANTTIPCVHTKILTNSERTDTLRIKMYQGNSIIAANNDYLGYLEYHYGEIRETGMGDVEVTISVDVGGFITLEAEDITNFGEKKAITLRGF